MEDTSDNLSNMTKDEMALHLQLCMKLAAENKINSKNAFGLHLIQLMQHIMKTDTSDLQQASLSLQAGSKIYSSRVEALYQDTFKFHSHLQSVVTGGKKAMEKMDSEKDEEMDSPEEEMSGKKSSNKAKSKSHLTSEASVSTQREGMALTLGEPHGNFATINATFSTARTAPKLLEGFIECDACRLVCANPQLCYNPKVGVENAPFMVLPRIKGILDKIKKFALSQEELEAIVSSTNMLLTPHMSTPKPPMGFQNFTALALDDTSPVMMDHNEDAPVFDSVVERLSILDITADIFVNEIFDAVKSGKRGETVDQNLLPPNSALKKMITASGRPLIRRTDTQKKVIKKKEKFFEEHSSNNVMHMFVPGRSCLLSNKALMTFKAENSTELGVGYFEFPLLADNERSTKEKIRRTESITGIYKRHDTYYFPKQYFLKTNQVLRAFPGKEKSHNRVISNNSFLSNPESQLCGRPSSMIAEDLAYSLQNLSLHELDDAVGGDAFDQDSMNFLPVPLEEPEITYSLELDMDELMVKPPELVKPANVKYDKTPSNFNTEEVKELLWNLIFTRLNEATETVLFSDAYRELKRKLDGGNSECISKQFTFVILLILANQKCLRLENTPDGLDISIEYDKE